MIKASEPEVVSTAQPISNLITFLSAMDAKSFDSQPSDVASGDGSRTTVMNNRASHRTMTSSEQKLMDLYMSQMPRNLIPHSHLSPVKEVDGNNNHQNHISSASSTSSSVVTPPPPPVRSTSNKKMEGRPLEIFRTSEDDKFEDEELEQRRVTDHPRGAWIIERSDSVESIDATDWPTYWNGFFGREVLSFKQKDDSDPRRRRRTNRLICLTVASFLVLCCIIGLSISLTNQKKDSPRNGVSNLSTEDNEVVDEEEEETISPSLAPLPSVKDQTPTETTDDPPTKVNRPPTMEETTTPSPVDDDMTIDPMVNETICEDFVEVDQPCYDWKDLETVAYQTSFSVCTPHEQNWIGVFPARQNMARLPYPLLWLWTCNSQNISDCNGEGTPSGVLGIGGVLDPGFYHAALVARDGVSPFPSSAISSIFEISEACPE